MGWRNRAIWINPFPLPGAFQSDLHIRGASSWGTIPEQGEWSVWSGDTALGMALGLKMASWRVGPVGELVVPWRNFENEAGQRQATVTVGAGLRAIWDVDMGSGPIGATTRQSGDSVCARWCPYPPHSSWFCFGMVSSLRAKFHLLRHIESITATLETMWDCRSFSLHRVWVLCCLGCDPIGSARLTQDSGGPKGQEALVVSPGTLDFGTISVIDEGTTRAEFLVTNAGDDTIAVHGHDEVIIALNGDADVVFEVAADPDF